MAFANLYRNSSISPCPSPLQAPRQQSSGLPEPSSDGDTPPLLPQTLAGSSASSGRSSSKRPREDTSQYATHLALSKRLKLASQDELEEFAKLSKAKQSIWLACRILSLETLSTQPAGHGTLWKITAETKAKVVSKAALIVLSPSLSAYRGNVSLNLLTQYIENNPNSTGVPVTVRNDDQRWALLCAYVKEQLTLARNKVKGAIAESLGVVNASDPAGRRLESIDIVELCNNILAKFPSNKQLTITIKMCARIAFLRQVYASDPIKSKSRGFYELVDKELCTLRELKENDPKRISKALKKVLDHDRSLFGSTAVLIIDTPPSRAEAQTEIEAQNQEATAAATGDNADPGPEDEEEPDSPTTTRLPSIGGSD